MSITFFLGGARSGKSSMAEALASSIENDMDKSVIYVATAKDYSPSNEHDSEMQSRIAHHQASRPKHWRLVEEPMQLGQVIEQYSASKTCLLIDCLTLWVTNCLLEIERKRDLEASTDHSAIWQSQKQQFLTALQNSASAGHHIIIVSNEVGHGIVPMGELSRQFVDESGWLHQAVAQIADEVNFVMAGLSLPMKQTSTDLSKPLKGTAL